MTCHEYFLNSECAECDTRSKVVAQENRCTYIGLNKDRKAVCRVHVDGCLIKDRKRCDYLILNCDDQVAFFIELGRKDPHDAIHQIEPSIDKLQNHLQNFRINARAVLVNVRVPNFRNTPAFLHFDKQLKRLGGSFDVRTREFIESVND